MAIDHLQYSSADRKLFVRRLYGLELLVANYTERAEGFSFFTGGCRVLLPSVPHANGRSLLSAPVSAAWKRLRFFAPSIATRTIPDPESSAPSAFAFSYTAGDEEELKKWAEETIVWDDDGANGKPMSERDAPLQARWWKASDGRYNIELHVSADVENRWQFYFHGPHWSLDGRCALQLFNQFFHYLAEELTSPSEIASKLKWGEETVKLPPGSYGGVKPASEANGAAPKGGAQANGKAAGSEQNGEAAKTEEKKEEAAPAPQAPFFRPVQPLPGTSSTNVAQLIVLSKAESAALHKACKSHGKTITQAVNSLLALAEVEMAFKQAVAKGGDKAEEVKRLWETAAFLPIAMNFMDKRGLLQAQYSIGGEKSTPCFCLDGAPIVLSGDSVRKAIKLDVAQGEVQKDYDAFWSSLVEETAAQIKAAQLPRDAYLAAQDAFHASAPSFDKAQIDVPALVTSSIGDLDRLGFLSDWKAHNATPAGLVVETVDISVRAGPLALVIYTYWQWEGELTLHLHVSDRYQTKEDVALLAETTKKWLLGACAEQTEAKA